MKVASLVLVLSALASSAHAVVWSDSFEGDSLNPTLWSPTMSGGPTLAVSGGRLNAVLPANSSGAMFWASAKGVPKLVGDFDARIDYSLDEWPVTSGVRVGLSIGFNSGTISVERLNYGPGNPELYLIDFGSWWNGFGTTDLGGSLRMTRVGREISGWAFVNGNWERVGFWGLAGTEDVTFAVGTWSHDGLFSQQQARVSWDNFYAVDSAVPEPATWLALSLGGLFLARRRSR